MIKTRMAVISYLMETVKQEMKSMDEYHELIAVGKYSEWKHKRPSKQLIKDNLKMIRRVSIEIEKEMDVYYG